MDIIIILSDVTYSDHDISEELNVCFMAPSGICLVLRQPGYVLEEAMCPVPGGTHRSGRVNSS